MEIDKPLPALRRDLQAVPIEHEDQPFYLIEDPEGLSDRNMALTPAGMVLATMMDGLKTAEQLRSFYSEKTGTLIELSEILTIAKDLEEAHLLESPSVRELRLKLVREFKESPVRKAVFAGSVYPSDRLELARELGGYLRDPQGPGQALADKPTMLKPPLALMSPHIDFKRGGPEYAWAYQALSQYAPPDLVIALGVAHSSPNSPWIMTKKNYETPYGPMETDQEAYEAVRKNLWYDPLDDEWVHRKEHSLEFQAVWLKSLWKEKTPPWLPILCSTFERFCPDKPPSTVPSVWGAIQKIGETLSRIGSKKRVMILAGVDLAHVGPRFGDDIELNRETEKKIEKEDRASLEKAMRLDADDFYLSVVKDGHWRKVCGLSALYTSLCWTKALAGGKPSAGNLLAYGQAPDPMGGLVSFASAVFAS